MERRPLPRDCPRVLVRGSVGLRLPARFPLRTSAGTRMRPAPQHGSPESGGKVCFCVYSSVCLQKTAVQGESKTNTVTHHGHANKSYNIREEISALKKGYHPTRWKN